MKEIKVTEINTGRITPAAQTSPLTSLSIWWGAPAPALMMTRDTAVTSTSKCPQTLVMETWTVLWSRQHCRVVWLVQRILCGIIKLIKLFYKTLPPLQPTMNIAGFPSTQFSYLVDILQFSSNKVIFQFHPLFIHQGNANISQQVSFHLIFCRNTPIF